MMDTSIIQERIGQLCYQFKLPTVAAEATPRFTEAGHGDALPTLLEVLEQEAEDRRHRRINRLRRESRLPAGKTWETFEHDRVPLALRQQLDHLAQGSFVERCLGRRCRAIGGPVGTRFLFSTHLPLRYPPGLGRWGRNCRHPPRPVPPSYPTAGPPR